MAEELIDGVEMKLGRATYIVPSLTFKQLHTLMPQITTLQAVGENGAMTDEMVEAMTTIVHAAMMRNYPNMARSEVEDFLDLRTQNALIHAIMGQQALKASKA